ECSRRRRGVTKLTVTHITKSGRSQGHKTRPADLESAGPERVPANASSHAVDVAGDAERRRTRDRIGHDRHGAHHLELHRERARTVRIDRHGDVLLDDERLSWRTNLRRKLLAVYDRGQLRHHIGRTNSHFRVIAGWNRLDGD